MKQIGLGNTAEIYLLDQKRVLKLFREGIPESIVKDEFEKSYFIESIITNTPKAYELMHLENRAGIVYSKVEGYDMIKVMLRSVHRINFYSKRLADMHLELHKHSSQHEQFNLSQKLNNDINATDLLDSTTKKKIQKYINQLPQGNSLCHFDFHPGNIMLEDQNHPIIIDWMTACIGNKYADVARTYLLLTYGELPHANFIVNRVINFFQKYIAKIYLDEYIKQSGAQLSEIKQWMLPVAAARLHEWLSPNEREKLLSLIHQELEKD
ncbi:aminoglycoside phosphotransferase family protein [Candidatus Enterococcus ferrettii]|uniref:Aminoglycoside phosphotransferase domain-containing protein n=1 Tax=Candidatus Enterococcus ferrettii TaxID=2815324 RepID=A0ABV0ESU8_9ENTE|nr:aminoglycoside phosphotransferase family protein [Enterococcus sp. 665A]MBO1341351.1 phosphotransferase [Enterococcus sp. 665A]